MRLKVNGKENESEALILKDLLKDYDTKYDVFLINGFPATYETKLSDGDEIVLIKKGIMPPESELETLMCGRHTPKVHEVFKKSKVAIAGLGGLGSNIARALARVGVGEMLLVDFDVVEPSNLNRQAYFVEDLGKKKNEALIDNLKRINPYNNYIGIHKKVEREDVLSMFADVDVVVEAFDNPGYKAMLVNEILKNTDIPIVSASGIAGLYNPNSIQSKQALKNLYLIGDGVHEAKAYEGLMAPRVMIAAGHQATIVCQILLDEVDI